MKKFKRALCVILACVMIFCVMSTSAFATQKATNEMQFDADGKFTVLDFSDFHCILGANTLLKTVIKNALNEAKPDLVVLSGDNITKNITKAQARVTIASFMNIFQKAGVPVCVLFGNHDILGTATKNAQIKLYEKYSCFVPQNGDDGAFDVTISDKNGSPALNLLFFDSGRGIGAGDYSPTSDEQLNWAKNESQRLRTVAKNDVPSVAFQHIVVPQIMDVYNTSGDKFNEHPCPSSTNTREFSILKNDCSCFAMSFGHDHSNTFDLDYDGVRLLSTPTTSFNTVLYNDKVKEVRGARVFTFFENDVKNFDSSILFVNDLLKTDSQKAMLNLSNELNALFLDIYYKLSDAFSQIKNMFSK